MGKWKTSAGSADQTFSGTISIKSRTGAIKEMPWETKLGVLTSEKTAAIETPEMQVFYEGIPIELKASATGMYKNVRMSVPSPYTAPPGSAGKPVVVSLTATDASGKSVSLGTKTFMVKKAPKPELVWNGVTTGNKANKNGGSLGCRYDNNVPFAPSKGKFAIVNYAITFPGAKTPIEGTGSTISAAHLAAIKSSNGAVGIQVRVTGSYNGLVDAMFK
jgi:hypothetical protein